MRAPLRLIALGSLAVLAATSLAQMKGDPAPDIEAAGWDNVKGEGDVSLERYKNKIIVLINWSTYDSTSVELFKTFNELHEKFQKRGVMFLVVTKEKKTKAESTVQGKEAKFIVGYEFDPRGKWTFPATPYAYIIDIYGNVAHARFHAEDELEERIEEVIRKAPPPGASPEFLEKRRARLTQLVARERYGKAYTLVRELIEIVNDEDSVLGKGLEKAEEQIEEGAKEWLKEARDDIKAKNYKAACRKLAELSVRFKGDIKEDADRELGRLQGDLQVKPIVRKALDNAEGELKNDNAAELLEAEQYIEARELYREVVEEHEDTEAAEAAQDAIDEINGDPTIQVDIRKVLDQQQAARWYDLGERFARVQMFDLAREHLEKVVKNHPASSTAQKAQVRLDKLADDEKDAQAAAKKRAAQKAERARKAVERDKQKAEQAKDGDKSSKPKKSKKPVRRTPKPKPKKPDRPKKPRGGGGGARPVGP